MILLIEANSTVLMFYLKNDKHTVVVNERVEDGEDLAVVWDQRFAHHISTNHQVLHHFKRRAHNLLVSSVQRIYVV